MFKTDGQGKIDLDLDVIVEKAKTPEGKAEVQEALKGIKGYTGEQFTSVLNNHRDSIKDSLMKENKIEAARVREKSIKEKYKLTHLVEGTDYKSTEELVGLVLAAKEAEFKKDGGKGGDTDEELKRHQVKIQELTKQLETDYVPKSKYDEAVNSGVSNYIGEHISMYAEKLDEANGDLSNQLKFLRFTMAEDGITFGIHKGEYAAFKGGKLIEGGDLKPVSVKNVIKEYADKALKLKVPAGGRGDDNKTGHVAGDADLLKIKSTEELASYMKEKNIIIGSTEQQKISDQWLKLHKKV